MVSKYFRPTKGISQEVRRGTLTAAFGGSNPSSPAIWDISSAGESVPLITGLS